MRLNVLIGTTKARLIECLYRQRADPTARHDMDTTETMTARDLLKVRVEQKRNMFGKRQAAYEAHLGETGWTATGTCKEGALQLLQWELTQAKQNEHTRRYIRVPGATFCLYWAGGWCYDIVHDDHTSSTVGGCLMSTKSLDVAFASMARHAEQMRSDNVSEVALADLRSAVIAA